ncbi:MAG: polysaccharide deacetylase family protein [Candidatus Marinimicrobia bacterium]|nr:polysaccharide deacetylase family protein [Candidatus Neomarinimicrobiota bacterium]
MMLKKVPVLLYHHVNPQGFNTVKPTLFETHIAHLKKRGYTGITFRRILTHDILPEKPVVITFDDGYDTIFCHALPILEKYAFKAVVFMLSGYIGKKNTWDLSLEPSGIRHLNQEELTELSKHGWEIAAHSLSHHPLTCMSLEQAKYEIEKSGAILEDLLNMPTDGFAYPFGRFNNSLKKIVQQSGYHYACGALKRHQLPETCYELVRIPVYRIDGIRTLEKKLSYPQIPYDEFLKLKAISSLSKLTPVYQAISKKR